MLVLKKIKLKEEQRVGKMKLTSKGRFAVTSLVDLALNSKGNNPVSLSEISSRQQISVTFLEQIFSSLKKRGIVRSIRGAQGGYLFAKEPNAIMLLDVIEAIDEDFKINKCNGVDFGCNRDGKKTKCLTHNLWKKLTNHIHFFLNSVSIEDVKQNQYNPTFQFQNNSSINDINFTGISNYD